LTFQRPPTASMTFRPSTSVILTPSPPIMTLGGLARMSAGCAMGCHICLALCSWMKLLFSNIGFPNLKIGPGRVGHVKMDKGHVQRLRALNILKLIIDEETVGQRQV